jgi:hypothetical protein
MPGFKGYSAPHVLNSNSAQEYKILRTTVKESWNTNNYNNKRAIGSFRAVNNAGDFLSRKNYSCGGSTQSFQSRPNMSGLKHRFGSILSNCDGSGVPAAACNTKYVYDSSDYIKYLRQRSINRNYNDISHGGDQSNASQSALSAIKR